METNSLQQKISERLLSERNRLKFSQTDMATRLGVDYKTVARWEKGGSIPSDKLELMAEIGIDIIFMLTGKTGAGAGFSNSESNNINDIENMSWRAAPVCEENNDNNLRNLEDYAFVPLYDVEVSAGHGAFLTQENIKTHLAFTKYSIRRQGLQPDQLACVQGKGDSMQPTITEGDTLMIDLRANQADGGIFVFRHAESLFVKRLMLEKDGIRVISDNKIYPEWVLNKTDDYEIIGKRVWHARWD